MGEEEKTENAANELELKEVPKKKKEEPKKVLVVEQTISNPTKEELDLAGAVTITQFIRSENLGLLKQGFAIYCQNKGVGGRKTRIEWMALFRAYKATPIAPSNSRRGI